MSFYASIILILLSVLPIRPDWGFYGHRTINRKAVFTLPPPLIEFYKNNIEYITAHAVDPDKRRYASKFEAMRHYIDIDHWGTPPFEKVPRDWHDVIMNYGYFILENTTDTFSVKCLNLEVNNHKDLDIDCTKAFDLFYDLIEPNYYEDEIIIESKSLKPYLNDDTKFSPRARLSFEEEFSSYGILPYHLKQYYQRLVDAFYAKDHKKILRLSAEIGHYIGDAHVPLHTTENYNGQLSDQIGIHAFWESRLPELFADKDYDFFVGKAEYLENVKETSWEIVMTSHSYLDEVLEQEKLLSKSFPQDQQFCFEDRLERTVQTQCEPYANAYHKSLDGMVEQRMRDAIHSIGSFWYSAWIDAGQPDLRDIETYVLDKEEKDENEKLELKFKQRQIKGREH